MHRFTTTGRNPLISVWTAEKKSKRFVIIYRKIVESQFDFWLKRWAKSQTVMPSYARTWVNDNWMPDWHSTFSMMTKRRLVHQPVPICWKLQLDSQTMWKSAEWRATHSLTIDQESPHATINDEDDTDSFFQLERYSQKKNVPMGQTVSHNFYKQVWQCLCHSIHRCCPQLRESGNWFLFCDNARPHTMLSVQLF